MGQWALVDGRSKVGHSQDCQKVATDGLPKHAEKQTLMDSQASSRESHQWAAKFTSGQQLMGGQGKVVGIH